ncbi:MULTISPECIES: carboxymuconolactone decarboxylase family protein [unclassified Novosphingobium]|uniref:carboxymuconolactone decarboxylase family protein n=1 Tax=unclassified Novosphingobium TaxID=2644732 RepID=UPI00020EEB54|nr:MULTISPECIES: carboxymuconolactone decarboxylase family protein [unclassified Novosphingobium]CCA92189.1 Carboxymuconolactone decarboxylase [Novosphingobium sp. PP1Y]
MTDAVTSVEPSGVETAVQLSALGVLRCNAPMTVAGFQRWRSIIETDGAVPARIKLLFVACAACVKGYVELGRRELAAAREAGLNASEAGAAVAILSSVRGEGAALRFHGIAETLFGPLTSDEVPDEVVRDVEPGAAESNFLAYFGEMPPSLAKLLELKPLGADAYYLMREGTLSGTALASDHAELLLVTVLVADYSNWASVHMNGARRAGASEEAIAEAVICAVPTSGLSAWVVGATAMDA